MAERKIMGKKPIYLETRLPKDKQPSLENNELIINRFLKACSKESLLQFLYERSAYTKRFEKRSVLERRKRLKYKRNAQRATVENMSDGMEKKKRSGK